MFGFRRACVACVCVWVWFGLIQHNLLVVIFFVSLQGVKECMGPERIKQYVEMGVKVWSGNDDDMHYCRHVLGAQGSISVAANVVPAMYRKMLHGPRNDSMNASLSPLFKWLFVQPNPIAINTV